MRPFKSWLSAVFGTMKEVKENLSLLLGFAPWLLFLFLSGHSLAGLERAVVVCLLAALLLGAGSLRKGFILQWGTLIFFAFCFGTINLMKIMWVAINMNILANGTLALIMWVSVLAGRPFALQYARENLPRERWNDPAIFRSCRCITMIWGGLMLISVAVSLFKAAHPDLYPDWVYFDSSLSIIIGGIAFTVVYKHYKRRQRELESRQGHL